jgi:hypothetical protein
MEKSKIIEYVLNEWAMRSPDGLADGFDVQENIDLLENILKEYGLDEEDIQNVMEKTAKPRKPKAPRVLDSVWSKGKISLASLQAKNIPEDKIEKIINFMKQKDQPTDPAMEWSSEELDFIRKFDKLSPTEAADYVGRIYSSRPNLHDASHIIGFLDSDTLKGRSSIGRGEYPLVFLIAGCKTGRGESGDLVLGGGTIDVKESVGGVFRVEDNSFKKGQGKGFNNLKIVRAMDELEYFVKRRPDNREALLNLLRKVNDDGGLKGKEFDYALTYFENPNKEAFGVNVFNAIISCRLYFKLMSEEQKVEAITSVADFKLPDKEVEVAVDIPDEKSRQVIENPPRQETPVQINVTAIGNREKSIIVPEILKLQFFSDDTLTPEQVGKELLPELDYTGIIIINKVGKNENAKITWVEYIEDLTQSSGWYFYSYSKGIKFKKK